MNKLKLQNVNDLGYLVEQFDKTLIQFSADWCGPCRRITPLIEEKFKNIKNKSVGYVYIDIDEHKSVANAFNVSGIPHFVIYDKETNSIQAPIKGSDIDNLEKYCNKNKIFFN